jgi:membrane-bound serine protease (ClpP class)
MSLLSDPAFAFFLMFLGALGLAWELHSPGTLVSGALGLALLLTGAYGLEQGGSGAFFAGSLIAAICIVAFLVLLALRTRTAKRLNGVEKMVGEVGVVKTELNPEGTILVNGEYWRATSDHAIPVGEKVAVTRVHNLLLHVTEA